ncbi:MAG: hypothetical protein IKS51_06410 [Erysipelotrichaceae bacterium]|nr:hypothetical protein [Erysipelotrichaceae bacterium]
MKNLIIVLLLAFLVYALYYFIFKKKGSSAKKESGLSVKAQEAQAQSQLLKQQLNEETSDLKDTVETIRDNALHKEEKKEEKPAQSSLLREDLAEQVAETREKSPFAFEGVKHGLQDNAEDMLIKPELFDEGLAEKAAAVKEETDAMMEKEEDKITLKFGDTLMQSKLVKEEREESKEENDDLSSQVEEKMEDIETQSSLLREDLAEKILAEREDLAAKADEHVEVLENAAEEVKDTLLDLSHTLEADADNKTFDVHQHFEDAQAQPDIMKDDIDEVEKETVVVKKFVRKERE